MDLEDVYLHFLDKFESLQKPRSVAEARITSNELEGLKSWFLKRLEARMWCESTCQVVLPNEASASRQEMFGALILLLASEVCRAESSEDAVWPAVNAVFKENTICYQALFVGGQPTTICKNALAAGARRLNLRNLIDRYGAQEYFDTLKLQFGFTLRGAVRRLPEWLDGLGLPIAVKILSGVETEYGDLNSSSFTKLWKTLHDFRRGRVSEEYTSAVLRGSPWIRLEWTAQLLQAAKLRITRPPSGPGPDPPPEPICEPMLRWENLSKPTLLLRINYERICEILSDSDTATFAIDGRVVDRWTAQEGGGWRGKRDLPCQPENARPNLRPKLMSISSQGRLIEEVDLLEMGIGETLLIFDLGSGTSIDPASRLDPAKDYAVICDADLSIPDAIPDLRLTDRSAYRLVSPWPLDLRIFCDGILYWQARVDDRQPSRLIQLTIESPPGDVVNINSAAPVRVTGIPDDTTAVSLAAGNSCHPVIKRGPGWQTEHPVQITLGMALGQARLRVRVTGRGYARTVVPKLCLNLRGIACIDHDVDSDAEPQWKLVDPGRPLNRAGGSGQARMFVGPQRAHLYEGPCLLRRIAARTLPLRDLHAWGDPIVARFEDGSEYRMVGSVEDRGSITLYVPSLLGKPRNELHFRTPVPHSGDHYILAWFDIGQDPKKVAGKAISSDSDGFVWKLPDLGTVKVMAVAYQGAWIGSYWTSEPIIRALHAPSPKLFSLLRWLKIPVLNPSFKAPMEAAIGRAPDEFVLGWLKDAVLTYSLIHRPAEQGLYVVIRAFFWNYTEKNEGRMDRLVRAFPRSSAEGGSQSEPDVFKSSVVRLGQICPSLAYNLARLKAAQRQIPEVRARCDGHDLTATRSDGFTPTSEPIDCCTS